MKAVSFEIPVKDILVFKEAANQLQIDLMIDKPCPADEQWITCHASIEKYSSLVALSYIAGMNQMHISMTEKFSDFAAKLMKKFDDTE